MRHKRQDHVVFLSLAKGEVMGLLGPNGAGKIVGLITGLISPDSGQVFFKLLG